jgi:stalled ribosome rescue protein Dom34
MATAGLWIDHRKAVIVTVSDEGEATRLVESNVERHVRYSGGVHSGASHESQPGTGEDTRERHFEGQLNKYYDEVIERIRDAEAILIFGPGEAKGELKTRLERDGLGARIVGVETVDKMTDRQIAAKVRERLTR